MSQPTTNNKSLKKITLWTIVAVAFISALGVGSYFYMEYKKLRDNPEAVAKQESRALTGQVGKLITLPTDEEPTVATVQDKEKLKEQPFFKDAQNGDKILIYTKSKKAIIYRPSTNTLVNVGPIALDGQNATVPVAILKGSSGANVDDAVKELANVTSANVISKGDAKNKDHKQTIVADVSGNNTSLVAEIAQKLGGTVGQLPEGEQVPASAKIVIIVAK